LKLGAIFNRLIYGEGQGGYGACGKPIGECMCGMGMNDCKDDEHYHPEHEKAGKNGCMKNHLMNGEGEEEGDRRISALRDTREMKLTW
jgi:hypothetical protein